MKRVAFDMEDYIRRCQQEHCWVCGLVEGNPDNFHQVVAQNEFAIAFLSKYQHTYGHVIVSTKDHREHVTADFSLEEYLHLQEFVFAVAQGMSRVLSMAAFNLASWGSQQGNRHVHWHIGPHALGGMSEKSEPEETAAEHTALEMTADEKSELAKRIHDSMTPCPVCELARNSSERAEIVVHENDFAVAWLNKTPTLRGHVFAAPKEHREQRPGGFTLGEHLEMQRFLYFVGEAVRKSTPTERLYLNSPPNRNTDRHIIWDITPLPPGVPYEKQQGEALNPSNGVLSLSEKELRTLNDQIRECINE